MAVRDTSSQVYAQLMASGVLSDARAKVYDWLFRHGPATCNEVAVGIGERRHGSTSGRLTELRDLGVVRELGVRKCSVSGMTIILWDVTFHGVTGSVQKRSGRHRQACLDIADVLSQSTSETAEIALQRIREICAGVL